MFYIHISQYTYSELTQNLLSTNCKMLHLLAVSKTNVAALRGGLYRELLDSLVSRKQMTHGCFYDPLFVFPLIYSPLWATGELKHAARCLLIILQHDINSAHNKTTYNSSCFVFSKIKLRTNLIPSKKTALLNTVQQSCLCFSYKPKIN